MNVWFTTSPQNVHYDAMTFSRNWLYIWLASQINILSDSGLLDTLGSSFKILCIHLHSIDTTSTRAPIFSVKRPSNKNDTEFYATHQKWKAQNCPLLQFNYLNVEVTIFCIHITQSYCLLRCPHYSEFWTQWFIIKLVHNFSLELSLIPFQLNLC